MTLGHSVPRKFCCRCHTRLLLLRFVPVISQALLLVESEARSQACVCSWAADTEPFSCHDPAVPRRAVHLQQQCILTAEAARRLSGQAVCSLCDNTCQLLHNPVTALPSHCTSVVDGLLNSDKPSLVSQPGANNILHDLAAIFPGCSLNQRQKV